MAEKFDALTIIASDADRMTALGRATYGYDTNGNQTSRNADTFAYDHENRMTSSTAGGVTTTYIYNGDGLRLSKATGGVTTSYIWDIAARLPVIIQEQTGTNLTTFVYGRGLICTMKNTSAPTDRLIDGLGSTIGLTDWAGNVTANYRRGAFGDLRYKYGSESTSGPFAGEERDSESGLDYLRARYYDPEIGRFLAVGPVHRVIARAGVAAAQRVLPLTGLH